jgi:ParB family chromosome partitioning protein
MGQARPLVGLDPVQANQIAQLCVKNGLSARQMEKEAKRLSKSRYSEKKSVDADVLALQDELTRKLGLPVTLHCKRDGSGELKIAYTRPEELDDVLSRLRKPL